MSAPSYLDCERRENSTGLPQKLWSASGRAPRTMTCVRSSNPDNAGDDSVDLRAGRCTAAVLLT
jgi:hypothetical protein